MTGQRDTHREDVIGRANVEDTPELLAYYDQLQGFNAGALWTVANKIEPWQPQSRSVPVLWRYRDLRDHVVRSVDLVTPEKAGRRVIYLNNPGRTDVAAAVAIEAVGRRRASSRRTAVPTASARPRRPARSPGAGGWR